MLRNGAAAKKKNMHITNKRLRKHTKSSCFGKMALKLAPKNAKKIVIDLLEPYIYDKKFIQYINDIKNIKLRTQGIELFKKYDKF